MNYKPLVYVLYISLFNWKNKRWQKLVTKQIKFADIEQKQSIMKQCSTTGCEIEMELNLHAQD